MTPALEVLPAVPSGLLALLAVYHLVPVLPFVTARVPSLAQLPSIIPHPRRNLPREFFDLPPRDAEAAAHAARVPLTAKLGVRGCLVLLALLATAVSTGCGWAYIVVGGPALLALAVTAIPAAVVALALAAAGPGALDRVFGGGGIKHTNVFSRIAPVAAVPAVVIAIIAAVVPHHAGTILLATTSVLTAATVALSSIGMWRRRLPVGPIRLPSASPELEEMGATPGRAGSDWLSSPSDGPSQHLSSFSFPSHLQTPHPRTHSTTPNGSPTSWISSPGATPATVPDWSFSSASDVASPEPAHTRDRVPSPLRSPSPNPGPGLPPAPPPSTREQALRGKMSSSTMYTATTAYTDFTSPGGSSSSAWRSPGGSIIAAYEPDPSAPLPRRFESLGAHSLYPMSPGEGGGADDSAVSLAPRAASSADTLACVPVQVVKGVRATSSAWTLASYHSAKEEQEQLAGAYVTPTRRRAAPPPPMPMDMPLPPTPTYSRAESPWGWGGKDSSEMLLGDRDWVQVDGEADTIEGWGEAGRGVGMLGVCAVIICFALDIPLFLHRSDITLWLFLVSLALPSPLLAIASYLLRYRAPALRTRAVGSTRSGTTHRSLALVSESQLSLPVSISPKLTPPDPKRQSTVPSVAPRWSKLIRPQPSASDFGARSPARRHTVYGAPDAYDLAAEEEMRRMLARRSGDVWLQVGHAKEGMGLLARAAEMIKPVPALRVLDGPPARPDGGLLRRLRGGVVSMLPAPPCDDDMPLADLAPVISITSPSKYDCAAQRASYLSALSGDGELDDPLLSHAQIQTATRARRSASPSFVCRSPEIREGGRESYDLDCLSAGVIPALLPQVRIGPDVRVQPAPTALVEPPTGNETPRASTSVGDASSSRRTHARGYSSSVDLNDSIDFSSAFSSTPKLRQRKQKTLSLPDIDGVDFADMRRSVLDLPAAEGVDLPPIPQSLARLSTLVEGDVDADAEADRSIARHAAAARRFLEPSLRTKPSNEFTPSLRHDASLVDKYAIQSARTTRSYRLDSDTDAHASTPRSALSAWTTPEPYAWRESTFGRRETRPESGWADDAEDDGDDFDFRPPATGLAASVNSMATADEAAAEEMEAVLAMDTPTRSEFVISPPPQADFATPSSSYTYATTEYATDGTDLPSPPPPVPPMPAGVSSHPHPPPLQLAQPPIRSLPAMPSMPSMQSMREPHPPVRGLQSKASSDTLASDATSADPHGEPLVEVPPFNPSKKQLELVQRLRERTAAVGSPQVSTVTPTTTPAKVKEIVATGGRGLKPLQLVQAANRGASRVNGKPVLKVAGQIGGGKLPTGSDVGAPGGTENMPVSKRSKMATGSGPAAGLRA